MHLCRIEGEMTKYLILPFRFPSGEGMWVKRMIDRHHVKAAAKGIKIVHSCAYDSIPADLGTLLVVEHMRRVHSRCVCRTPTDDKRIFATECDRLQISCVDHLLKSSIN